MNNLIKEIVKNQQKVDSFKHLLHEKNDGRLSMSFLDKEQTISSDKTFGDASEFWASHENSKGRIEPSRKLD